MAKRNLFAVALSGDRNWRKGNPNWKKGRGGNPAGKDKGTSSVANASAFRILKRKGRNPVTELIALADLAASKGDYIFAGEIWKQLHEETTKHASEIEAAGKKADITADLVRELEGGEIRTNTSPSPSAINPVSPTNNVSISRTNPVGEESSVAERLAALSLEADTAGNLRLNNGVEATNLRGQLLAETGEVNDNGSDSHRNGAENPE